MSKLTLAEEASRRRTFAIIAHPDAGKTTLTEHILLAGGAIRAAGAVRARGEARRTRSDWMKIEKERGISVSASVMTFEHDGKMFNLLDTPGHEDFSEDTYRTLTAADCAIMVLDAAKGIEPQTLKLFEVCRLRDIPIITFINKLDREAQDPLALLDDIAVSGFGLTLGVHSRVEAVQRRVAERLRVGNTYVNRNQVSAVVGVQPFGGHGLSGTGPKAGGPVTLIRFATELTVSVNTTAAGGNASLLATDAGGV